MKTRNLFLISVTVAFGLTACSKSEIVTVTDEIAADEQGVEMTFKAWYGTDEIASKTVREADGKVYWVPGDKISMFRGNGSKVGGDIFTSSKNTEGATDPNGNFELANFTGTMTSSASGSYFGLYPYDATATCDGTLITTTLPSQQVAAEGTFANNLFISVGKSNAQEMAFYNLCGGVKFTLTQSGIKQVVIKGNNDEILAGKVKIGIDDSNCPFVESVVSGEKEIVLTTADGSEFKTGVTYYFICLPTALENGFTMTFRRDMSVAKFNYANTAKHSIRRSVFGSLTNVDSGLSWIDAINFFDPKFKAELLAETTVDTNGDGEISTTEAAALKIMHIDCQNFNDCREMVYFTGLEDMEIYNIRDGQPAALDLSRNTKITSLYLESYQTQGCHLSLDLSNQTALETLYIMGFDEQSIDFTKFTNLSSLRIDAMKIATVDLSKCQELSKSRSYGIYNSQIGVLDISNIIAPEAEMNPLRNCNINSFIAHNTCGNGGPFHLADNRIQSIDIQCESSIYTYTNLRIRDNAVKNINIDASANIIEINNCTSLETLDLSKVICDNFIDVSNNALTSLTLPEVGADDYFNGLDCSGNQLETLNIRGIKKSSFRFDCSPMNDANGNNTLKTLYVTAAQNNIEGVTINRSTDKIPAETQIISTSGSIDDTVDENW